MASLDLRQTNKLNIIFQSLYALLLNLFVFGSYHIEESSAGYFVGFFIVTIIGFVPIYIIFLKNRYSETLKYLFAMVQTVMYLYIMLLGHSENRFVLIIPILFYLVLYHSVGFVISISLLAMAVNILNVFVCIFVLHMVTYEDSSRYVIQLMLIICSMFAASITAWFYRRSYRRNLSQAAELEQIGLSTIETIANTIDAKDAYTQGHSRRVADVAVQLARHMGKFTNEEIQNIHYVALLHDVGKIAVPDSVLNKPTRLTPEEFALMKTHTTAGAEILKDVKNIKGIVDGVKYHHERYDGKGYPEGLKGEEIPEIARIICLADSYDAMTSNRVYRKPLPIDMVINEIKSCRGTQFAPEVVDAFIDCVKNEKIIPHTHDEMGDNINVEKEFSSPVINVDSETEFRDQLSGAYQEKYGLGAIEQKLINQQGVLALFNIVGLRRINNELGFRVGDYYIKAVANIIIGSSHNPFTVRFNGNQFLCYLENADKKQAEMFIKDCLNRVSAVEENDPLMEKSLDLTCAAKVIIIPKAINEHIENLEKVLFLLKGKEGEYAFYDSNEDDRHFYDISKDMEMLINAIKNSETDSLSKAMGSKNIDDAIKLIKEHPNEEMGVAILTIKPMDEEHIISINLEYAMKILEAGMNHVIQENGIVFHYSSLQRMMLIYESGKKDLEWDAYFEDLEKEILSFFHKNYDKIDVELSFNASLI